MRLEPIVKYRSGISRIRLLFCLLALLPLWDLPAQTFKIDFRGETLANALTKASEQLKIKVAYDAKKASTIEISKHVTGNTPEEFMKNLLSGLSFDYVYKHNRFLIIDKQEFLSKDTATCQVVGTVCDGESGEQLPYASIVLPEQGLNTYASSSGSFSFKNVKINPFRMVVNFIGYAPVDTVIQWNFPIQSYNLHLRRKVQVIDTVVVKSPRLEMIDFRRDVDFATTLNVSKLIDLPLLVQTDVFRTLQLLPGISYSENSSELSIHGGSSDQNLILFDGQTLYNLSHYYGVISALNPNVIKDVQVFKGGFDSRYGERVSGIVDITAKTGNYQKVKVYGDLNLVSGNITAEVPLGNKISVVAAYRRSYSDIYATESLKKVFQAGTERFRDSVDNVVVSTPNFSFYDYNAKITYRPNSREVFSLSHYGGRDYFDNIYNYSGNGLLIDNVDKNTWSNFGLSGLWSRQWNASLFTNLQIGASGYKNRYFNKTAIEGSAPVTNEKNPLPFKLNNFYLNDENNLGDIAVTLRNTYSLNNKHQFYFGAMVRQNNTYYQKDAGDTLIYDHINQTNWVSSIYFLDRIRLNNIFTLKPGLRLSYYSGTNKIYPEPRFAIGADFNQNLSFRIAYGHYCQFISQVNSQQETGYIKNFWVMADGDKHPVINSNHYILGGSFRFRDFLFDAEVYYKGLKGIQEYFYISHLRKYWDFDKYKFNIGPQEVSGAPQLESRPSSFINGTGKAYGVDLLLQYKKKHYTGWVSYSISRSLQNFAEINYGNNIPSPTDQLHQLSFNNMVSLGNWNFGSILLLSSGKAYFLPDKPVEGSVFRSYKRLPNYSRLDLSANYSFKIFNTGFKVGASVINVLNTTNYYDINFREVSYDAMSFTKTNLIRSTYRYLNLFLHFDF